MNFNKIHSENDQEKLSVNKKNFLSWQSKAIPYLTRQYASAGLVLGAKRYIDVKLCAGGTVSELNDDWTVKKIKAFENPVEDTGSSSLEQQTQKKQKKTMINQTKAHITRN